MGKLAWLAACALMAAGSEAACGPPKPAPLPDIGFREASWGATVEQWTITNGRVEYRKPKKIAFGGGPGDLQIKRFALKAADIRKLGILFAAFRKNATLPDKCENYVPDGPYGNISWTQGGKNIDIPFNGSCLAGDNAKKASAGFAIGHLISDLAKAEPVVATMTTD